MNQWTQYESEKGSERNNQNGGRFAPHVDSESQHVGNVEVNTLTHTHTHWLTHWLTHRHTLWDEEKEMKGR